METMGLTLAWCAIQVTIFASASALLYLSMRKRSPAARSTVLISSLLSVIVLTVLARSPWPRWVPADGLSAQERIDLSSGASNSPSVSELTEIAPLSQVQEHSTTMLFLENLWDEMKHAPVESETRASTLTWQTMMSGLFLTGFTCGLIRLFSGLVAVYRYRHRSVPVESKEMHRMMQQICTDLECRRIVQLRVSETVSSPATIGWRQPIILLPVEWEEWNSEERLAVIAHEVAHICRFDFPAWFAAQVGVVLHFYHPIVHWLAGKLRLEQELAADAAAARILGGNTQYLEVLAGMALRRDDRSMSWAARTFLPSHHTFIRRIEMLRRSKPLEIHYSLVGRGLLAALMLSVAVFAAGLRSPFEKVSLAEDVSRTSRIIPESSEPETQLVTYQHSDNAENLSLAYVPRDSVFVMALRPAKVLANPMFAPLRKALEEEDGVKQFFGVSPLEIKQLTLASLPQDGPRGNIAPSEPVVIVHFENEIEEQKVVDTWVRNASEEEFAGVSYYSSETHRRFLAIPNSKTAIFVDNVGALRRFLAAGPRGATEANWSEQWQLANEADAALLIDVERLRPGMNDIHPNDPASAIMNSVAPLWKDGDRTLLWMNLDQDLSLSGRIFCRPGTEANVEQTLQASVVLTRNGLSALRERASTSGEKNTIVVLNFADLADEMLDEMKITSHENEVHFDVTVNEKVNELVAMLLPAVREARTAAKRTQSMNNMKQIGLAMHNYHDVHKRLPPAVVMGPDGKTPHSWRVELLPYLDQAELYNEYRMNEPWDSEHNKTILERIPLVFRCPQDDHFSTNTSYYVFTGKGTAFEDPEGQRFRDFTDGLSNTLLVVESKKAVPWTKPEDIPIDLDKDLPKFGGYYRGGFNALLCDGSVRFISENIDKEVLKLLIQRNDGKQIPR
ncbi:MAG: DUF1559 domain-containing protein [Planctomycetaceae bacterium]|nr:DUF1559 domain-containing protein [Planctomycetaceae bacterium]